jgi:hypothetical protein
MSFVLLLTVLAAFDIRADQANRQALSVHFDDIGTRVANAVLGAVEVGAQRAASDDTAESTELLYYETLRIPTQIRGQGYRITLTEVEVTVSADEDDVTETAPLFNLQVPIPAACGDDDSVCALSGTARSSEGYVLVKYEYKRGAGPSASCTSVPTNCVTIG